MFKSDEKEDLIIEPVPALIAVLVGLEQEKGSALTEVEVLRARDNAECIAMPRFAYQKVTEARGYEDINPEFPWQDWLDFKGTQHSEEAQ